MAETFDAVLIGAGVNTLASALHLAAKGWRVGVFEQAAVAGGAVKTGESLHGAVAVFNIASAYISSFRLLGTFSEVLRQHSLQLMVHESHGGFKVTMPW